MESIEVKVVILGDSGFKYIKGVGKTSLLYRFANKNCFSPSSLLLWKLCVNIMLGFDISFCPYWGTNSQPRAQQTDGYPCAPTLYSLDICQIVGMDKIGAHLPRLIKGTNILLSATAVPWYSSMKTTNTLNYSICERLINIYSKAYRE